MPPDSEHTAAATGFRLLVASAYPECASNFAATRARETLQGGEVPGFVTTADPVAAEAILFFEHHPDSDPFYLAVLRHPLVRRFPDKCLVYHDHDLVAPFLPGFYCSLRRGDCRPGTIDSWVYLNQHCPNPAIRCTPATGAEPYLFSFVGAARTHPVRRGIMRLAGPGALVEDTSAVNGWSIGEPQRRDYHARFAQTLVDSSFVLCPRGAGPNSYRAYEAMQAGRVPVILSDDFPAPVGLPWERFALFVPEAEVATLPQRLAAARPLVPAMGRAAREAWEQWCAWPAGFAELAAAIRRRVQARNTPAANRPLWRTARLLCSSQTRARRLLARSLLNRFRSPSVAE